VPNVSPGAHPGWDTVPQALHVVHRAPRAVSPALADGFREEDPPAVQYHSFDAPERFVIGAVGEPGAREFFLQASAAGQVVSVGLEKTEAAALADGLAHLLDEVQSATGRPDRREVQAVVDHAPLDGPVEEQFRLSGLTVAWDGEFVVIEAAGAPAEVLEQALRERFADDTDDELGGAPTHPGPVERVGASSTPDAEEIAERDPELVEDLEAVFASAGLPVPAGEPQVPGEDDDEDDPLPVSDVLRVQLTVRQAYAFVARTRDVVASGRQPCVLCGRPDGPDGHVCPRLN
jgi:uncharacterized repeat protein (TIGR03847 family)